MALQLELHPPQKGDLHTMKCLVQAKYCTVKIHLWEQEHHGKQSQDVSGFLRKQVDLWKYPNDVKVADW